MSRMLDQHDAVLLVDLQNDFCKGGALEVPEGDAVIPIMNRWASRAAETGARIIASRDWHPPDHCSFRPHGGPWPVHCVQDSDGAQFHPDVRLPDETLVVDKAMDPDYEAYSDFQGTGLADWLRERGIKRLWVGGLATEYCVKETVLDGCKEGFEVHLLKPAIRAVNVEPGDGERAIDEMKQAGAIMEED